jgi:rubrerythrin
MPNFFDPFSGKTPDKKLTNDELIRAIRLDIAGEHEAIHGYTAHADATNNQFAKKIFLSIANEEKVHVGELTRLLDIVSGDECKYQGKGAREVNEKLPKATNIKKKVAKNKK